jgi:uncharacterized integral membrane protein
MRLFSWFMTLVVIVLVVMFFRQNASSFAHTVSFSFDLGIGDAMKWSHSVITLIVVSVILGFVVGLFLALKPYMSLRRRHKETRQQLQSVSRTVSQRTALPGGEEFRGTGEPERPAETVGAAPEGGPGTEMTSGTEELSRQSAASGISESSPAANGSEEEEAKAAGEGEESGREPSERAEEKPAEEVSEEKGGEKKKSKES